MKHQQNIKEFNDDIAFETKNNRKKNKHKKVNKKNQRIKNEDLKYSKWN